jgi:hypothetical protein
MADGDSRFIGLCVSRRGALLAGLAMVAGAPGVASAQARNIPATDKKCATCDFWGGQRQAAADKRSVIVAADATGLCSNPRSPLYNRMSRADQGFADGHRRWRSLS